MDARTEERTARQRFVKINTAAEIYGMDRRTVIRLAKNAGALHTISPKVIRVDLDATDRWICEH